MVKGIYELTGKTPPSDVGGNLRLDFSEADLERLRQIALTRLGEKIAMNGDGRPTNEEIAESLRENHGIVEYEGGQFAFGGVESLLGEADTADEALIALYHGGLSSGAVAQEIEMMLLDDRDHPMDIVSEPQC